MTSLFSLFACAVFFMALFFLVFQVKRWGRFWPVAYAIAAVLMVLPINHWLLIEFVRGYLSDLSVMSLMICSMYLWSVVRPHSVVLQPSFKWFTVCLALFIYPMSMGLTQFDPFTVGYPSHVLYDYLLVALCVVGLFSWFKGFQQIAIVITLGTLAHGLGLYESQNIWTYLIDPIAVIVCGVSLVSQGAIQFSQRFKVTGN